jgi:hypothetical protein
MGIVLLGRTAIPVRLPQLIFFVSHSYENCRGAHHQFPFWLVLRPVEGFISSGAEGNSAPRACRLSSTNSTAPVVPSFRSSHVARPDPIGVTARYCSKSFSCNTYGSPRKCCKQKTYGHAKFFRCNTYRKHGEPLPTFRPNSIAIVERRSRPDHVGDPVGTFILGLEAPVLFLLAHLSREPVTSFGHPEHKRLDMPREAYTLDSHELRRSHTGETPWLKLPTG